MPDFVIGTHIRVNLIGKKSKQSWEGGNNLYYTAIKYFGISGSIISGDTFSEAFVDFTDNCIDVLNYLESEPDEFDDDVLALFEEEKKYENLTEVELVQYIST